MAQKLIDADIINLFINGTDEDRAVLGKVYPEINFETLKWNLMLSLFRDHQKRPNVTYPMMRDGKLVNFYIRTVEDDLT
jgi:hypothetical protein